MLDMIKEGFRAMKKQPFILIALFVYRTIWGLILYKSISSIVIPLLHRFPDRELAASQTQLFMAEAEFQLTKTDLSHPYLWMLFWIVLARMLLTPVWNAGIIYSFQHPEMNMGYRFVAGIRKLSVPYFFYSAFQMLLTVLPIILLYPLIKEKAVELTMDTILYKGAPIAAGLIIYGYFIHLIVLYLQFGKASGTSFFHTLAIPFRRMIPILFMAVALLLLSLIFSLIVSAIGWFWAGLSAIVLHQAYGFIRTAISLWGVACQYHLFRQQTNE